MRTDIWGVAVMIKVTGARVTDVSRVRPDPGRSRRPGARRRARRFARLPCRSVRHPADPAGGGGEFPRGARGRHRPARPPRHSPRFVLYTVSATHELVVLITSRGVSTATTFENSTKRLGTVNARVEDVEAAAIRKDEPSLFGVVLVV